MKEESRPQANGDGSLFSSGDEGAELTENQAESQADELGSSAPWSSSAERNAGSWSYDDPERPRWDFATKLVAAYDYHRADGSYSLTKLKGLRADGEKVFFTARRFQGRMGELQSAKQESPGGFLRQPGLELYMRGAGDEPDLLYRLSEARDLGDVDRFAFYDHMKAYTAAPPDVLRVDEKFQREYSVFNVCGVIITSNHKSDGIYLPEDDRRHYVAWSELTKTDFEADYWQRLWAWYRAGGLGHVAAFLRERDIRRFDPKAPPPKTEAFWDIVASNSAPEAAELSDALEQLRWPGAVTLGAVTEAADASFAEWLRDHRNSRKVPHKMEECGYRAVRNPNAKAGRWKVSGKDVVIYAKRELCPRDAIAAAEKLTREGENAVPF